MSPVERSTQSRNRGRETDTHRADLNRSTAHLWFLFLAVCYGLIAYKNLHGNTIGHDEVIYLVKSWWIFSGQLDWYSNTLPLSYLPGSHIFRASRNIFSVRACWGLASSAMFLGS